MGLQYEVALRSNHGVWMLADQRIRQTRWRPLERVFTDGSAEQRFIRETTWDVMTNQPGKIEQTVGSAFGLRTWVKEAG